MPLIVGALIGAFIQALGTMVGRVLVSLGVSYVSYVGIDTMVEYVKASFISSVNAQHNIVVQLAGVLQIGTSVNIICSAMLARLVVKGLQNGALTSMQIKG